MLDLNNHPVLVVMTIGATSLPIVVAITHIGVQAGRMHRDIAAALVGAAILSVLLFPAVGGALRARNALPATRPDPE